MATMINNARIDSQLYEFAVIDKDGDLIDEGDPSYENATDYAAIHGGRVVMRCVYYTEWMDAT